MKPILFRRKIENMGTCCSNRTAYDGGVKNGETAGGAAGAKEKSSGVVKFNTMDVVRTTIAETLADTANHEMVVLNLPKESFTRFFQDLQ